MIGWMAALAVVGAWFALQKYKEDKAGLERSIKYLVEQNRLLHQFICESSTLRIDAKAFIDRGFNCSHDMLGDDHENCICISLPGRANAMLDRERFYSERNGDERISDMDGLDSHWEDEARKGAAENQTILIPIFERLHKLAPKSITSRHVEWLRRDGISDPEMARYMSWILPELRHGGARLNDEASKAVLAELESLFRGKTGSLCDVIMFVLKPSAAP